jgi:flavin-dependent dehydrogenase
VDDRRRAGARDRRTLARAIVVKCDLAIVGGGPVGLAVAIEAARAGLHAVVLERSRGIVDKACGEGLMPHGVARLQALGVDLPAWGVHPFRGIRYVDDDVVAQADFRSPALGVRRTALEEALRTRLASLGGELRTGAEVRGWRQDGDKVVVDDLEARWLVAADGLHSRVRKEAGFAVRVGDRRRMGMRRHFHVRPWSPYVEVHWTDGIEAYVTPTGPDRVGVALLWGGGDKGNYDRFLARFPALAEKLGPPETEVRGAGPFDVTVDAQVRGRVLLVGDAAGYVDAITGEGVALGLTSAQALIATLENPAAWTATWRRVTRRHRQLTRVLLAIADRPMLRRQMIRAFLRHPALFESLLAYNSEPTPRGWELGEARRSAGAAVPLPPRP